MTTFRDTLDANQAQAKNIPDEVHSVEHKHTEADQAEGVAGAHTWNDFSFAPADVKQGATEGTLWATHESILGSGEEFTPSNGMHSTGADHVARFNSALHGLGHVKQGPSNNHAAAPGVARATIADCGCTGPCTCDMDRLHATKQDSGFTFRQRQADRRGR